MDGRAERAHEHGRHQITRDGGGGLDVEQQDQHRRHQRAAAGTGQSDQEPYDRTPQHDVRVDSCQHFTPSVPSDTIGQGDLLARVTARTAQTGVGGRIAGRRTDEVRGRNGVGGAQPGDGSAGTGGGAWGLRYRYLKAP